MSELPITHNHDYSLPIGYLSSVDGELRIRLAKDAKIAEDAVRTMNQVFVPTYEITKVEDGIVTECRLLGLSLVNGPRRPS